MTLIEFAAMMERKLAENSHKGESWKHDAAKPLLARLRQETLELQQAIENGADAHTIAGEAADVANFAYFLADNFGGQGDE